MRGRLGLVKERGGRERKESIGEGSHFRPEHPLSFRVSDLTLDRGDQNVP